jgi:hypothetical protein
MIRSIFKIPKVAACPVNAFEYYTIDLVTRKKIYAILSGISE